MRPINRFLEMLEAFMIRAWQGAGWIKWNGR